MRERLIACASALAFMAMPLAAFAEDNTVYSTATQSSAIVGFDMAFFTAFSPVTALDMVSRVPGFSLSSGDTGRRGLADSFGNLLINGRRPSNKTISLETVLQRINADDVAHIELIREPLPEYEMRGHARLVNVVLREGAGASGSWSAQMNYWDGVRLGGIAEIAYSTTLAGMDINLGLESLQNGPRIVRRESLFDGQGNQLESRHDNEQRLYWEHTATASIARQFGEDSRLQLDARLFTWEWHRHQNSHTDGYAGGTPSPLRYEQSQTANYGTGGSFTGTLNHDFSNSLASTTTFLWRRDFWDDGPEAFETYDPVNFANAIIFTANAYSSETVLRQSMNAMLNDQHSIEFGGEMAINWRDTSLALQSDDGVNITPIAVPVANTRVEERRAELFVNHVWSLTDTIVIESGIRYETSELEQTGDTDQSRSFSYPKPSIALTWQANPNTSFRFAGRRDVAQLEFGKFASSVDVADNNAVVGNPDYEPQRTWTLEAEAERRIGDGGSLTFRIGQDWIEGVDDFISIVTPNGIFDAPGNIGDGTIFRLTGEASLPLDSIGLSNAVLDGFVEWYDTDIYDTLTQQQRHLSNLREWEVRLDYRQSFPELDLSWGWDYFWLSDGEVFRASEYRLEGHSDGDLDIYVESTRWSGLTLRVGADQLLDNGFSRQRVFYDGSRATGVINSTEYRNQRQGPLFYVELRGTF
jgi:TonB dependent receptor-like, beta-barrel